MFQLGANFREHALNMMPDARHGGYQKVPLHDSRFSEADTECDSPWHSDRALTIWKGYV